MFHLVAIFVAFEELSDRNLSVKSQEELAEGYLLVNLSLSVCVRHRFPQLAVVRVLKNVLGDGLFRVWTTESRNPLHFLPFPQVEGQEVIVIVLDWRPGRSTFPIAKC